MDHFPESSRAANGR